jgi:hypothetical protein
MLPAARNVLVTRPALWAAAAVCTLLVAIPQALLATAGAAGAVAFLLTGDAGLALEIWERAPGSSPAAAAAGAVALAGGFVLWARLYAVAIALSRTEASVGWREAALATRGRWRRVALMHLHVYLTLAAAALLLGLAAAVAGPSAFGTLVLLAAGAFLLARTLLRIVLSIALRAVVLEDAGVMAAWRGAAGFVREKRHDVAVAWVGLVAIGVSIWIAGRLITPVLQDTAYDYPATSGYEAGRQLAQLVVSLPIETALFAFGVAVWTAVYEGVQARPPERSGRREPEPWIRKALVAGLVVALLANGLATVVDDAYTRARAGAAARVAELDVKPEEVAEAAATGVPGSPRTRYRVEATLEGEDLSWVTTIDFLNDTGDPLTDVGLNVYANAYTRALRDVPFARDLATSDFNGEFAALAAPGSIEELEVAVEGRTVDARLRDTALLVELGRPLAPGRRTAVRVTMRMQLPRFPERFGRWRDLTLLGNWIPSVAFREAGSWRLDEFGSIGDPFFAEVADYDVTIAVDDNTSVVGTGTLVSVQDAAPGLREWHFDAPAVRDAAFVAGPFLRGLEADAGGTVVRSWYPAGAGLDGRANLDAAASAVAYYTEAYGALPWPEVDVVATEGRLGGMEYPGVVFVSSASEPFAGLPLLPDLVSYSGFEAARSEYVVGHELAHQWWFASVGSDQIHEPWLDEAMAEASTRLWLGRDDDGTRAWLMTNLRADADPSRAAVHSGIADFRSNEDYTEEVYLSGSEVLLELRRVVGAATYDDILRTWHERHHLGVGTIAAFAGTVRTVAGERAAAFLEDYF